MPRQDPQGRWISDDGLSYWDGSAWRPMGVVQPASGGRSPWPAILIGCGFAVVVILVLGIGLIVFAINNADFQRGFCNGYMNGNPNQTCPFHPSPP